MKEKISRNKISRHYKSFFGLENMGLGENDNLMIDWGESLVNDFCNQEVEKRIAERMPSEEEINKQAEQAMQRDTKDGRIGIIIDSTYYGVFCDALEWLRSRLTCSEKPNNSKGGEG